MEQKRQQVAEMEWHRVTCQGWATDEQITQAELPLVFDYNRILVYDALHDEVCPGSLWRGRNDYHWDSRGSLFVWGRDDGCLCWITHWTPYPGKPKEEKCILAAEL